MWIYFVNEMKQMLDTFEEKEINGMTKNEVVAILDAIIADETYVVTHIDKIIAARDYMKSLCRTKTNKASGVGDIAKVAEAILKFGVKTGHPCFAGAGMIGDTQYVSDGHILMAINKPVELPKLKEGVNTPAYNKFFEEKYEKEIEFPTFAELKEGLKKLKAEAKANGIKRTAYNYVFDDGYCLNVQYMIWAVQATGSTKGLSSTRGRTAATILEGNGCKVMILPIYNKNAEDKRGFIAF